MVLYTFQISNTKIKKLTFTSVLTKDAAMGILDDLNIKVEEIREEQLKRDLELEVQEKYYREQLRPLMLQAHRFLSDIVHKLNIIQPEIRPSYPLNPLTKELVTFDQSDHRIDSDGETN